MPFDALTFSWSEVNILRMRVSYRWLFDYVDIPMNPYELASELERIGIETEEIDYTGEGLDSLIVGEIRSHAPHPHAPGLRVAEVDVGTETLKVVCGAPNLKNKVKGALALPGTLLADGTRVTASEIRGVLSQGMLVSERELGISDDHSGIIVLPESLEVGAKVAPYYELDDYIFELEITPNRPDLLSVIGIAREISAITGGRMRVPRSKIRTSDEKTEDLVSLHVKDAEGCPRYMARVVKGVNVRKSPRWLTIRLKKCGLNEVNNVVDVTNYVLFELGHPLHAFDLDCLDERTIVVRRASTGEGILTLDGDEKTLKSDVLVIADSYKPVALAGIVGGSTSGVTHSTSNVLLESAFFNPALIRRASRILGIETEASIRFEKRADISILPEALDRAAQLISRLAGGKVLHGSLDFYSQPQPAPRIPLRRERVNMLLGLNLTKREIKRSLRRIHIQTDSSLVATVPSFRRDLKEEVDLIEEVARIHGYERIPSVRQWKGSFAGARHAREDFTDQLRRKLSGLGFTEVYSLSFADLKESEAKGFSAGSELVALRNPLSERWNSLRNTLLLSLMKVAETNLNRGRQCMKFFEIGRVFENRSGFPEEEERVALLSAGENTFWDGMEYHADFYDLKGDVESLLNAMDVADIGFASAECPFLHPGRTAHILLGEEKLGILGELTPMQKLSRKMYVAELSLEMLFEHTLKERRYQPISRFPVVQRDLALLANDDLPAGDIERVIIRQGGQYLESVTLFDLYMGDGVPEGKRGLTYRMRFRAKDRTLEDADVDRVMEQILSSLREDLSVTLRGGSIGDT